MWRVKASSVDAIRARNDVERLRQYFISSYKYGALYALITTVGCNTGLRAGDLLSLRVGDVRGTYLQVLEQKTKKTRRIFINGRMRADIDKYLSGYVFVADTAYLFRSQKTMTITVKTLHRLMKDGCRAIGLEGNYGSHSLRKTFAFHAYAYTHDLEAVRRLLNHSGINTTLAYVDERGEPARGQYERSDEEVYSSLNL